MSIRNERVKVNAHFHEQGSIQQGSKSGSCDGFEVEISIDSDEPPERVAELIRLAHAMCFTEAALISPAPVAARHVVNGRPFDPEQ